MELVREARSALDGNRNGSPDASGVELPFDQTPRIGFFEQLAGKRRVQRVAAAMGNQVADDGISHEGHVADDVENLVPHELVFEPQRVERAGRLVKAR